MARTTAAPPKPAAAPTAALPPTATAAAVVPVTTSPTELGDVVIESVTPNYVPDPLQPRKVFVLLTYLNSEGSQGAAGLYRPNAEAGNFGALATLVDAFEDTTKVITDSAGVSYNELQEPYTLAVPQTAGLGMAPLGKVYRGLKTETHYITPTNLHTSNTHGRKEEA